MNHFLLKLCVLMQSVCKLMLSVDQQHNLQRETQTRAITYVYWRWRNYFSQLLNVHGVNDVRPTEIHTAGPLEPEPRAFEFELAIGDIKCHNSPGVVQISAELFKAGDRTFSNEIHNLIVSMWNKEDSLRSGRNPSLCLSIRSVMKHNIVIMGVYHSCQIRTKFFPTSCSPG